MSALRLIVFLCFTFFCTLGCKSWGKFWSWKLSGTVVNLRGSGLVLKSPGLDDLSVPAQSTSFAFSYGIPSGSEYKVAIHTPAIGQQCIVTNGTGIAAADVTNIVVTCYGSAGFDTSFASGGVKTLMNIGGQATAFDVAQGLVIDSSDRILIVGRSVNITPVDVMIVCRILTDGNLDTTFASASSVPGCAILMSGGYSMGYGIALDETNNRIYATGVNGTPAMLISRLTMAGALDTTFNGTGFAQHFIGTGSHEGRSVAVDAAGRPVIAGRSNCPNPCDWFVWRFNTSGTLDTSFNGTGYIQTATGYNTAYDLLIQSDSKIVVTGGMNTTMTTRRYNADGSLDTGFNSTGSYAYPIGSYTAVSGHAIIRDTAGDYLIAGEVDLAANNADMALWKLKANGTPDTAFNGSGFVSHGNAAGGITNPTDFGSSVVQDAFGRILVAGISCNNSGFGSCSADFQSFSIVVWRYNSDGSADTTFNNGSHFKIVDDRIFAQNIYTTHIGMKLDSAGRIVIAGGRDDDGLSTGDGQNLRIYRLFN